MTGLRFVQIDEFYPIDPLRENSFHHYVNRYYIGQLGLDPERALLIDGARIGVPPRESLETVWPGGEVDLTLRYRVPASPREELQRDVLLQVDEWCTEYEQRIRVLGGVGFFLGGIGPDGHIGFNVRGSDLYSTTRLTAVNYETQAAAATDLPPGVLNVITGADKIAPGTQLLEDPRVDVISFTGSTATGRRIMAAAAASVKRVFLELGGKSANILLDDADFGQALYGGLAVCYHAGQGCSIPTRMLVPRARVEEAVEALKTIFESLPYGDPDSREQILGPVISQAQRERVLGYVETGKREGARLVTGGGIPPRLPRGFYVEPTLFAGVDNRMRIAQEEIFGPVLAVIAHDGDDDAVQIANDSIYGLAGAVHSADRERALAVARRLRAGTVNVNTGNAFDADAPFGGYRQSGIGREMGVEGFEEYLQTKTVGIPA